MNKNKSIIIEVFGGVASVIQTYKGVTITIKDHDNKVQYKNIDGCNYASKSFKVVEVKKDLIKYYLLEFNILDGEHEHTERGICRAENIDEAEKFGKSFAEQDNLGVCWFVWIDKTAESRLKGCQEITYDQAKVLNDLGVISPIDGKGNIN